VVAENIGLDFLRSETAKVPLRDQLAGADWPPDSA